MIMTKKFPKSVKKFIARQKGLIRREILDTKKQQEAIEQLYKKVTAPAK